MLVDIFLVHYVYIYCKIVESLQNVSLFQMMLPILAMIEASVLF